MKKKYLLSLDVEIMNELDRYRGLIPKSTFINDLFKQYLDFQKKPEEVTNNETKNQTNNQKSQEISQ
jgi:hypothetical protein